MDMTVLNFISVPSRILANSSENSVLDDEITVTADIEVNIKLQL